MGAKNGKEDFDSSDRTRQEAIAKLFKNKKISQDFLNDIDDFQQQRKLRSKQTGYGLNNPNQQQQQQQDLGSNNKNTFYHTSRNDKPLTPSSRLQVDVNDPLLIATLPAPLTSVFNDNNEVHHQRQYPPTPVLPPLHMRNTFNVAKLHHANHDLHNIDRNYTDPWRNAQKMAQNNAAAAAHNLKQNSNKPTRSLLLQELLECPICMNRYDNPHVLPCQHTFCKTCIATLKSNSRNEDNKINCPICRESHQLSNGIENLPANYTMKRLIELETMAAEKEAAELANRIKIKHKRK
jgi:hypothetical protein